MATPQKANSDASKIGPNEAKVLMAFLDRVDLKGKESRAHAALMYKLELITKTPAEVPIEEIEGMKGEHREN